MVVDDDDDSSRQLLAECLKKLGYAAVTAKDGREALVKVSTENFALILLDVQMPVMDGFAFLKEYRARYGYDSNTNIMMVTASNDKESVAKALHYKVCDYLVKPYQTAQLLHKVSRWINAKVEKGWDKLYVEDAKILRLTMATLDGAWANVSDNAPIQFSDFIDIGRQISDATNDRGTKGLLDAVREHDAYTFVHSLRTGIFLCMFSKAHFNFSTEEAQTITAGGIIHDIGKARTPLTVLNKAGGFEPEEWLVMQEHVKHTVDILDLTGGIPEPVREIAWCHHEKLDGSGYPRHLKGEQIGTLARMAAIVDAYVALTDRRVYKPAFSEEKTFGILQGAPNHFDQDLVAVFKEILHNQPVD